MLKSRKVTKAMIWIVMAAYFVTTSLLDIELNVALYLAWPFLFVCLLLSIKLVFVDRREVDIEHEEPTGHEVPKIDWPPKDGKLPPR